jgi:hypothetical protein
MVNRRGGIPLGVPARRFFFGRCLSPVEGQVRLMHLAPRTATLRLAIARISFRYHSWEHRSLVAQSRTRFSHFTHEYVSCLRSENPPLVGRTPNHQVNAFRDTDGGIAVRYLSSSKTGACWQSRLRHRSPPKCKRRIIWSLRTTLSG